MTSHISSYEVERRAWAGGLHRTVRGAATSAVIILLAAGCSSSTDRSSEDRDNVASSGMIDASRCPVEAAETFGDTIKIGGTGALSGPAALTGDIARGMGAYFEAINDDGGVETVDGQKKIDFTLLDDQYTPSMTQSKVRELVERDGVDFVAGIVGTAPNVAVAPYLSQQCIPLVWGSNGADETLLGDYPFVTQYSSYSIEGRAIGRYVAEHNADATIGVLYQNDDIGEDVMTGLKDGISGSDVKIIESQSSEATDTDVRSQMTTLEASGADVFVNAAVTTKCTQAMDELADSSWNPDAVYFGSTCPAAYLSQAQSAASPQPAWFAPQYFEPLEGDSAAVTEFKEAMNAAGIDVTSQSYIGWNLGALTVLTLEQADKLTRVGVAEAAIHLDALPEAYRTAPDRNTGGARVSTTSLEVAPWDNTIKDFAADGESVDATQ